MNLKRALERIGYHPNEISVYLAILIAGELTVTGVAQNTDIPRSSAQVIVEHLHARGLLGKLVKRGHTIWMTENPDRLMADLEVKEEILRSVLPQLKSLRNRKVQPPTVRQFTGKAGIEALLNEVIISHYPVSLMGSIPSMFYFIGQTNSRDFFEVLFQQGVSVKIITNHSPETEMIQKNTKPGKHSIHYCDDERFSHTIYIQFNSRVAVILLNESELVGTLYRDDGVSQSTALLFETLWEKSTL
jgi:sugar-specific transcriptional regulator TrmB